MIPANLASVLKNLKIDQTPVGENPVTMPTESRTGEKALGSLETLKNQITPDQFRQVPNINADPWEIAVLNQKAEKRRAISSATLDRNAAQGIPPSMTIANEGIQRMMQEQSEFVTNPDTSRVDRQAEELAMLQQNAPGIPAQAELNNPNQNQLLAAGLAALIQPQNAFTSLARPFDYQVSEQARQQGILNQENALQQQRYQDALRLAQSELNSEYGMMDQQISSASDMVGQGVDYLQNVDTQNANLTRSVFEQDQLNNRAQLSSQTRLTLADWKIQGDQMLEGLRQSGRMSLAEFNDPMARSQRLYEALGPAVQSGQMTEDQRTQIAYAQQFRPFYQNQQTQAQTENTQMRTETMRAMLPFVPVIEQAKLEKLWADTERILDSGANDGPSRTTLADAYRVYGGVATRAEAKVDELRKQRDELAKSLEGPAIGGNQLSFTQRMAVVQQLTELDAAITASSIAATNARAVADEAGRRLAEGPQGGEAQSRGTFRGIAELGPNVSTGSFLLAGRFPMNLDQPYRYGACPDDGGGGGTDCGGFIGYAIRNGGDPNFPRMGTSTQEEYIKKNLGTKYTQVSTAGFRPGTLQVGDIVFTRSGQSPSGRHVVMVSGFNNGSPVYVGAQSTRSGVRTTTSLPGAVLGIYRLNG